jgi:endonuclease/exonuclease/phosphatase family metal-dependent hydrolase
MKRLGRLFLLLSAPFIVLSCARCSAPDSPFFGSGTDAPKGVTVMSYNVENLFDGVDNGTEYWDYDPGEDNWSVEQFHAKMLAIAEVIGTAVPKGPDIVALQEIENGNALETLRTEGVKNLGYRYSAVVEAPGAAVNTAVLSKFPIAAVRSHSLQMEESERLRNILEVEIEIAGSTVYLLNNHWKSKSGGAEETERLRIAAAELAERRIAAIHAEHEAAGGPRPDIVLCGDLNENHDEAARTGGAYPVALLPVDTLLREGGNPAGDVPGLFITGNREAAAAGPPPVLYSPWFEALQSDGEKGSYMYKGSWETIDHFLLSGGLFDETGFSYAGFSVINRDFMTTDDGVPRRWNREYLSGYSDHLPLLLELELR